MTGYFLCSMCQCVSAVTETALRRNIMNNESLLQSMTCYLQYIVKPQIIVIDRVYTFGFFFLYFKR